MYCQYSTAVVDFVFVQQTDQFIQQKENTCSMAEVCNNCLHMVSLPVVFNGHFPGRPGLASTKMYPLQILLELRVMEVVVTTGAIRCAKLQSNRHHQETNTHLFAGRMPFLSPNQQCQSTEWKHLQMVPHPVYKPNYYCCCCNFWST